MWIYISSPPIYLHGMDRDIFTLLPFLYEIYFIIFPIIAVVTVVKVMRNYYGRISVRFQPSFQIFFHFRSYHTEAVKSDH